jgi:hypothetical protein
MGKAQGDELGEIAAVEHEVDQLRVRTQELLDELEQRVRSGVDRAKGAVARVRYVADVPARVKELPQTMRRHPRATAGIGLGTAMMIGVGVWLFLRQRRAARRPLRRWQQRTAAWRAMFTTPQQVVAREPRILRRVVTAVLVAGATVLTRRLVEAGVYRAFARA